MRASLPNPETILQLASRLERISVDSYWAHRASGLRGALLKAAELIERGEPVQESELNSLMGMGYFILGKAAGEIPASR
jgi:hypothetical protein